MADKNVVLASNSEGHVWLPKFVSTSQPAEAGFVVWVWYQWKVSLNCNLQAMNRALNFSLESRSKQLEVQPMSFCVGLLVQWVAWVSYVLIFQV